MSEVNNTPPQPSTSKKAGNAFLAFLRALFRLIIFAALLALIGVVAFYGIPQLYRQYVEPFQASLLVLQETQISQQQEIQSVSESLDSIQQRINALEMQNDTTEQQLDTLSRQMTELNNQLEQIQSAQQDYLENITGLQEENLTTFKEISAVQTQLETRIKGVSTAVDGLDEQITELQDEVEALNERLDSGKEPADVLRREVQLVKAMELLTRSRMSIVENNLGLAEEDIQVARDLLVDLPVLETQEDAKTAIIVHLNLAIENLPELPVLAAENLEIAWQLLKLGLPEETELLDILPSTETPEGGQVTPTITPSPTPSATPTPSN